jgi:hypothetical protein
VDQHHRRTGAGSFVEVLDLGEASGAERHSASSIPLDVGGDRAPLPVCASSACARPVESP